MSHTATFERPVAATLIVRTEHGEEWEASDDDLRKFGLIARDAFVKSRLAVERFLGIDLSDHEHDAPEGHEAVWDAVNTALYLVESLTIYEFANLDDVEYRNNATDLGRHLGVTDEQAISGDDPAGPDA